MHQQQTAFKNIVGKVEIAQLNLITVSLFVHIFDIVSLFAIESEKLKIGISGKGLNKK